MYRNEVGKNSQGTKQHLMATKSFAKELKIIRASKSSIDIVSRERIVHEPAHVKYHTVCPPPEATLWE